MAYLRTSLSLTRSLKRRVLYDIQGSVCQRCERFNPDPTIPMVVDYEGVVPDPSNHQPGKEDEHGRVIEDSTGTWTDVLVKHHGAEEVKRFEFESRTWGWVDLRQMLKLVRWFDPVDVEEDGRLVVPVKVQLVRPR